MSLQADKPPLNFSYIDQTVNQAGFNQYIQAIQTGDEEIMQKLFTTILEQSLT